MNIRQYKQVRAMVAVFVGMVVSIATTTQNYMLSLAGVVTGMLFLVLVRSKVKVVVDERERTIREKAAQMTYAIFAPTIGIGPLFLLYFSSGLLPTTKEKFYFLESLGFVLSYLTLFLIVLYALSYHFLNKKYGGGGDEE